MEVHSFEPAWMSTVAHLDAWEQLVARTSWLARAFSQYRPPPGFPHITMYGGLFTLPLLPLAKGRLEIGAAGLTFTAGSPVPVPPNEYRDLITNLEVRVSAHEITAVERHAPRTWMPRLSSIAWVRVRTRAPGLAGDFLLCQGGTGWQMRQVRSGTDAIASALEDVRRGNAGF